jgi:phosphoenolpyruvate-protein kinase (PTS system EI component)
MRRTQKHGDRLRRKKGINTLSKSIIHCHIISPGITTGYLYFCEMLFGCPVDKEEPFKPRPETELERFEEGVASLVKDLEETVDCLESESLTAEAEIIRAHISMLRDPTFHVQVEHAVERLCLAAESAVENVIEDVIGRLTDSGDDRAADRAADLRDLTMQLKAKLSGSCRRLLPEMLGSLKDPVIAVPELFPSVVLNAWRYGVKGFLAERGTGLSHGAILAKAFGVPALRLPSLEMVRANHGAEVLVDAEGGELFIEPDGREIKCLLHPPMEAPLVQTGWSHSHPRCRYGGAHESGDAGPFSVLLDRYYSQSAGTCPPPSVEDGPLNCGG